MSDDPNPQRERSSGLTHHLTPEEVWIRQADAGTYVPEAYDADGFIHCTDGESNLLKVGSQYYAADRRPYLVLDIALEKLNSAVRYEDPERTYPHIYGPLNREAVVGVRRAVRLADGTFAAVE
jgi:uncharacterized protein (DUF952 family)